MASSTAALEFLMPLNFSQTSTSSIKYEAPVPEAEKNENRKIKFVDEIGAVLVVCHEFIPEEEDDDDEDGFVTFVDPRDDDSTSSFEGGDTDYDSASLFEDSQSFVTEVTDRSESAKPTATGKNGVTVDAASSDDDLTSLGNKSDWDSADEVSLKHVLPATLANTTANNAAKSSDNRIEIVNPPWAAGNPTAALRTDEPDSMETSSARRTSKALLLAQRFEQQSKMNAPDWLPPPRGRRRSSRDLGKDSGHNSTERRRDLLGKESGHSTGSRRKRWHNQNSSMAVDEVAMKVKTCAELAQVDQQRPDLFANKSPNLVRHTMKLRNSWLANGKTGGRAHLTPATETSPPSKEGVYVHGRAAPKVRVSSDPVKLRPVPSIKSPPAVVKKPKEQIAETKERTNPVKKETEQAKPPAKEEPLKKEETKPKQQEVKEVVKEETKTEAVSIPVKESTSIPPQQCETKEETKVEPMRKKSPARAQTFNEAKPRNKPVRRTASSDGTEKVNSATEARPRRFHVDSDLDKHKIFITFKRKQHEMTVAPTDQIGLIKVYFQTKERIPWQKQIIRWNGKELKDNRTFKYYRIHRNSFFTMELRQD